MKEQWIEKKNKLMNRMVGEFEDREKQFVGMSMFLGCVCSCFGILNLLDDVAVTYPLIFVGASNVALSMFCRKNASLHRAGKIWFIISICMMGYLLMVTGGAGGIGPVWILIAPAFAPFTFGIKISTVLCFGLFFQSIFLFWSKFGSQFVIYSGYTEMFRSRYPILLLLFFIMGLFLELIRDATFNKMQQLNHQLSYLSTHDPLTGAYNREGFTRKMNTYMKDTQEGHNFCFLISDIDFFKRINDTYGHNVGDIVLCVTEKRMEEALQTMEADVCRWGGEEFAILVRNKTVEESYQLAEEIRRAILEPIEIENGTTLNVSISIGGIHSTNRCTSIVEYVKNADEMLYYSKEHGRNQVTFYPKKLDE